ncbi:hypothetical protein LTS07_004019 [Exophiala sideris]|uniref:Uncharacterized protein n=1 Tax=Exophiala sideris TaxID=1016849 RepID=A0ABR0JG01_9EURO|nr:hypothetical protein LTS07_004019 [Exophiala sideris]KAK5037211.1 hypothetical protein LTR13_005016 [Exophiala sideris]KAK5062134.1 hypothetical protein LTR69_004492 [Exophiala sideris]KAK5182369.1 hypothetical protein LTR44_005380 [Eurotiomycetes sp. CCFEE 6388]
MAQPRRKSRHRHSFKSLLRTKSHPRWKTSKLSALQFIGDFVGSLSTPTIVGYGHLALLYALINNTIFVLFRLADPGTINLVKSGITLATALTSMIFLGSNVARLQWAAIGFQICGLMLSQYHPGQTFVSAIAGVFNQYLLKSQSATLHAQNMVLYNFSIIFNATIHWTIKALKPEEPAPVLKGLAITAIYKYADAIAKCFATAISTAILLYLAPLLFHTEFSFLMLPGTLIVFIATWMYMETASPRETQESTETLAAMPLDKPKLSPVKCMISAFTPWGSLTWYGMTVTTVLLTSAIVALNTWDIRGTQNPGTTPLDNPTAVNPAGVRSPFANTVGFLRMNNHAERIPNMLEKYEPFFHTFHYSARPGAGPEWPTTETLNLTHSTWDNHMTVYMPVAKLMRLLLSDEKYDSIDGLLNFHLDVWLNPMEFEHMDFTRAWLVNGRGCPVKEHDWDDEREWPWWDSQDMWNEGVNRLKSLNGTKYEVDKIRIFHGCSDLYYIPRRYFEDFIYLVETWYPTFHENTIPTTLDVLDRAYRREEGTQQVLWLADCWFQWGSAYPSEEALQYRRCGHRIWLNEPKQTEIQFRQARSASCTLERGEYHFCHGHRKSETGCFHTRLCIVTVTRMVSAHR